MITFTSLIFLNLYKTQYCVLFASILHIHIMYVEWWKKLCYISFRSLIVVVVVIFFRFSVPMVFNVEHYIFGHSIRQAIIFVSERFLFRSSVSSVPVRLILEKVNCWHSICRSWCHILCVCVSSYRQCMGYYSGLQYIIYITIGVFLIRYRSTALNVWWLCFSILCSGTFYFSLPLLNEIIPINLISWDDIDHNSHSGNWTFENLMPYHFHLVVHRIIRFTHAIVCYLEWRPNSIPQLLDENSSK